VGEFLASPCGCAQGNLRTARLARAFRELVASLENSAERVVRRLLSDCDVPASADATLAQNFGVCRGPRNARFWRSGVAPKMLTPVLTYINSHAKLSRS
jgi:hypothetical protein